MRAQTFEASLPQIHRLQLTRLVSILFLALDAGGLSIAIEEEEKLGMLCSLLMRVAV